MHSVHFDGSFSGWRSAARRLLLAGVEPHALLWESGEPRLAQDLFHGDDSVPDRPDRTTLAVPRQLLGLLEMAARYHGDNRWGLLYRILWRVSRGERSAMLAGDVDGSQLHKRIKAVSRELHHMHAFLRFRELSPSVASAAFIAWHEPAHDILELAVDHFTRRMGSTSWLIVTPSKAASWDGSRVQIIQPCPAALAELARATSSDDELWLAYYRSTFNPARLNRECLERSLPVRFWKNLPEGQAIPALMSAARTGEQANGQFSGVASMPGRTIATREAVRPDKESQASGSGVPDLPR